MKPKASSPNTKLVTTRAKPAGLATKPIRYVELLARSNFSFLQGASHPEEMVEQARRLGYQGLALCDLDGLYGVVRGHQAVAFPSLFLENEAHLNPDFRFHVGCELTLLEGQRLALLPMNKDGYTNLCQLITLSKRRAPKTYTALTLDDILAHHDDLIVLAIPGLSQGTASQPPTPWSPATLEKLRRTFHDRLYLPLWKDMTWESIKIYEHALQLEQQGFQLVATQRPFMHSPERKPLHDVLTCILHGVPLTEAKTRLLSNRERHLKPLPELAWLWRERPDLLEKSVEVSQRLKFSLADLRYQYPQADLPPGKDSTEHLRELTEQGLSWRYPLGVPESVRQIAQKELEIVQELNYEDYFLTLHDICEFARGKGILFQGRGSAANSVICFALGLTAVDPTQVELLFERFISKERGEPPDIDIDFDSQRREEVIQYIYRRYTAQHAAMVCTVICYRSRMALRETAKVLGIKAEVIDRMIKFMGRDGLKRLIDSPEQASEWGMSAKQFQLLMQIASSLKGFPRHLGIHTGGFVITQRPITECVPVEKATMDQRYVVQWNKDDLTVLKMMKIDVLGLGMLGALQRCFELLKQHRHLPLDLASIPSDDQATYDMICQADTVGVFQIESRAQMSLLPRLRPRSYYDLVVEVAIIRPGPIQGGMVHPYVRRRHGEEKIHYAHPALKKILGKTFGVPIFQEQIMQIASSVGGFTPGEADELRRIMSSSWKKSDLMAGVRQRLINGMLQHGIKMSYAEQIYQTIVGFASYGFPESHAASFALLTYASSYIKCHHPEVFVCALLNAQPMGFYPPRMLVSDAQRHGVKFLPVDLQRSAYDYTLETVANLDAAANVDAATKASGSDGRNRGATPNQPLAVRAGFRALYGLHQRHIDELLRERENHGPFVSLQDLVRRVSLPRSVLLKLAAAGALRTLGLEPRQALWQIQGLELKPDSLFFGGAREHGLDFAEDQTHVPKEGEWDQISREYNHQGYSLTHHPLGLLRPNLKGQVTATQLQRLSHGRRVRISGLLSLLQRPPTAKGFAFLSVEDEGGIFNVVLTPDVYERFRLVLAFHPLLEFTGRLEKKNGVIHLRAETIAPIKVRELLRINQGQP